MHTSIVRQLSAACVAAAALTASASVNAGTHYYATIHSTNIVYGAADNGAAAIIKTNILHQTCNTFVNDFVTHEMWYMTDPAGNYFVEVGVYDGEGTDAITNPCENHRIFWADNRPGGGLSVHWVTNGWNDGSYYQAQVTAAGNCTWNVVFGGLALGTSTSNCPGSGRFFRAGIETTTRGSGSVQGFVTGWQALDSSGNWSAQGTSVAGQGFGTLWMNWDNPPAMEQVGNSSWGIQTEEVFNEAF